jgi:hypothetical protein
MHASTLHRFTNGDVDLSLGNAFQLALFFGMEFTKPRYPNGKPLFEPFPQGRDTYWRLTGYGRQAGEAVWQRHERPPESRSRRRVRRAAGG